MPANDPIDLAIRREALAIALPDARLSALLLWLVMLPVVVFGWAADRQAAALAVALMSLATGLWRLVLAGDAAPWQTGEAADLRRLEHRIEANALASGLGWTVATVFIYPFLVPRAAALYVMIMSGSSAIAAFYMATLGRSLVLLLLPMILPLAAVSLFHPAAQAPVLAGLSLVYALVLLRAARRLRATTMLAIRHGLEAAEANARLTQARDEAESAALASRRFLATMSHELRTPMNGLLGTLALLDRTALLPPQRKLLGRARQSGEGLMVVLNDVLDMSKIQAERLVLNPQAVSPLLLAQAVVALFEPVALDKGLDLQLQVEGELPGALQVDGQRLRQVLMNLVGNALKFTDQGSVHVQLAARPAPGGLVDLRLAVSDTGIGIAPEAQARLFEPFHQADQGLQRSHGGTGLGLAISQRLVQAMGGQIVVHSALGEGCRFSFSLRVPVAAGPVAPPDRPPPSAGQMVVDEASMPPATAAAGRRTGALPALHGRVLLAEENPVSRLLASELLRSFGLQVQTTGDADGLRTLPAADLLVLDDHLPGLTPELLRTARGGAAAEPWLLLIDAPAQHGAVPPDWPVWQQAGAAGWLGRPFDPETMHALLARWLPPAPPRPAAPAVDQAPS